MKQDKKKGNVLSQLELSAFCTQVALMLNAAIPLHEGLYLMMEDSKSQSEQNMLKEMAEESELGTPLYKAMEMVGSFPDYVVYMSRIGEESGNLDQIMESLAAYYKKEDQMRKTIKEAVTYPVIMIFMMLVILFILMTKVMPVFEGVFAQLGTELSPIAKSAISIGGIFSGTLIIILVILVLATGILVLLTKNNIHISFVEKIKETFIRKSKISITIGVSRFCSVVSIMLKSGMDTSEILTLAKTIVGNQYIEEKITICENEYEDSASFTDALKKTGLFAGFYQQMITVGGRTGHLDSVLGDLSERYSEEVNGKVNNAISKFEPTMIAVLSVAVGLILLAVMLPLIGMMASMG